MSRLPSKFYDERDILRLRRWLPSSLRSYPKGPPSKFYGERGILWMAVSTAYEDSAALTVKE